MFPPTSGHWKERVDGGIDLGLGLCGQGPMEGWWGGGKGGREAGGREHFKWATSCTLWGGETKRVFTGARERGVLALKFPPVGSKKRNMRLEWEHRKADRVEPGRAWGIGVHVFTGGKLWRITETWWLLREISRSSQNSSSCGCQENLTTVLVALLS